MNAPINVPLEPRLTIAEGKAELILGTHQGMHHAAGAVHGAIYFKLLDDSAFFAANSLVPDVFVLTASFTVEFFRPVVSGALRAVGEVTKPGRNMIFASSHLYDTGGNEIGRGTGIFARSKIALTPDVGYR